MSTVQFRTLNKHDYAVYKCLINDAWHADEYIKAPFVLDAALDGYMRLGLLGATRAFVAEKDGRVLGLIVVSAKGQRAVGGFLGMVSHWFHLLRDASVMLICSKDDKNKLKDYLYEFSAHKKLLGTKGKRYDCCIEFFVVSSESRGLGVGKALLEKAFEYFRLCGAARTHLFTDTWCNYSFYEAQGFSRVAAQDVPPEEGSAESHRMFLYEKAV